MSIQSRAPLHVRAAHFIKQSTIKFNGKFDYSLVEYRNNHTPVKIICPLHGEFKQRPQNHIESKEGCYQCGKDRAGRNHRLTKEEFIQRSNKLHKNYYDYSKIKYVDSFTHVVIVCPIHGEFNQQPNDHMFHGCGCKHCGYESRMTRGEKKIADWLNDNKVDFVFQHSFEELKANDKVNPLRYDFFLPDRKVLLEFDGPHHTKPVRYKGITEEKATKTHSLTKLYDSKKEIFAQQNGFKLLRIPYSEIKNIEKVLSQCLE